MVCLFLCLFEFFFFKFWIVFEEVIFLVKENFNKVQKTLHLYASVFGFWLNSSEIKFCAFEGDRESKESPLERNSLFSLGLRVPG